MSRPRNLPLVIATRAVASVALVALGVVTYRYFESTRPAPPRAENANQLRRVIVVDALELPVGRRWKAYGTAKAMESADVPAQVGAIVGELAPLYREGQRVAKDDVLLTLDAGDFRRQLDMANEALQSISSQLEMLKVDERIASDTVRLAEEESQLAHADVERAEAALRDNAAMVREVDRLRQQAIGAERGLVAAREVVQKIPLRRSMLEADRARQSAAKELAATNLARCVVRSPLDGVLQIADKEVGEMVQPGMRVARVVGTGAVEVPILLPAGSRSRIKPGNRVVLRADRDGAQDVEATVTRIAPEDDPVTRTVTVYAETKADAGIAPGSYVEAEVSADQSEVRTVLPRRAISGGHVLEVVGDRVQSREVEIEFGLSGSLPASGLPDTEWVVLRDRFRDGVRVVLDASRQLRDGTAIVAVPAGDASHASNEPRDIVPPQERLK
ncbi:MAG: HlyD family efflux transporter periplasmic adaptor subunit [Phycisphaerales bacterium]